MRTMKVLIRHEGFAGLYQGLSPALLGSAVSWGGYFFLYEGIKKRWADRKREKRSRKIDGVTKDSVDGIGRSDIAALGPAEHFVASCAAGAAIVAVTNPVWLIKTRMQLQIRRLTEKEAAPPRAAASASGGGASAGARSKMGSASADAIKPPYKSMADAAVTIAREEGPLALYKGGAPALMLVSHGGVQFVVYEFMKENFGTYTKSTGGGGPDEGTGTSIDTDRGTDFAIRWVTWPWGRRPRSSPARRRIPSRS